MTITGVTPRIITIILAAILFFFMNLIQVINSHLLATFNFVKRMRSFISISEFLIDNNELLSTEGLFSDIGHISRAGLMYRNS